MRTGNATVKTGRRRLGTTAGLVLSAFVVLAAAAQAGPQLIAAGAHIHGFKPGSVVTEPHGTPTSKASAIDFGSSVPAAH
jgi:hypothetical protein